MGECGEGEGEGEGELGADFNFLLLPRLPLLVFIMYLLRLR